MENLEEEKVDPTQALIVTTSDLNGQNSPTELKEDPAQV